jgi:hypothetical protein
MKRYELWCTETNRQSVSPISVIFGAELCLANNKLSYLPSMLLPDFSDWQTIRVIDIQVTYTMVRLIFTKSKLNF